ncbi:MAG: DMT family transporter, partial [Actinomycetota bacterium]|nr:DMT family transporter [Actinomycetota bacterium]
SCGVLAIIPDATLVRLIDAPSLTTGMWRSGLVAVSLSIYLLLRYGRRLPRVLLAMGRWGVVSSMLSGSGSILFVVAVDRTSVANVVLILALTPMWAAFITRAVLGVAVPRRTVAALPVAFLGVAIAVGGAIDGSVASGDLYALWASVGFASNLTIIRARSHVDMVPTAGIGGALGFITLACIGTSGSLTPGDLAPLLVLGLLVIPAAMAFITAGGRYLPSAESSLLLLGETAVSPILAAVAIDEPLATSAIIGGAIVLATLFVHGWLGLHQGPDAKMQP